mmetsp:Transcript_36447/g.88120  ORF Transcript_36447/g.88120 Transcript_36447/m.88120 type:complete len:325 (-) Transcript_36447:467-1441(-)
MISLRHCPLCPCLCATVTTSIHSSIALSSTITFLSPLLRAAEHSAASRCPLRRLRRGWGPPIWTVAASAGTIPATLARRSAKTLSSGPLSRFAAPIVARRSISDEWRPVPSSAKRGRKTSSDTRDRCSVSRSFSHRERVCRADRLCILARLEQLCDRADDLRACSADSTLPMASARCHPFATNISNALLASSFVDIFAVSTSPATASTNPSTRIRASAASLEDDSPSSALAAAPLSFSPLLAAIATSACSAAICAATLTLLPSTFATRFASAHAAYTLPAADPLHSTVMTASIKPSPPTSSSSSWVVVFVMSASSLTASHASGV